MWTFFSDVNASVNVNLGAKSKEHCLIPSQCQGLFLHYSCQNTSSDLDQNIQTQESISSHCGRHHTTYTVKITHNSAIRRMPVGHFILHKDHNLKTFNTDAKL